MKGFFRMLLMEGLSLQWIVESSNNVDSDNNVEGGNKRVVTI